MKKIFLVLVFFIFGLIFFTQKASAQFSLNVCESVTVSPNPVAEGQSVTVTVTLVSNLPSNYPSNELKLAYGIADNILGWKQHTKNFNPVSPGTRVLTTTVGPFTGQDEYRIGPVDPQNDVLHKPNDGECTTTFLNLIDPNSIKGSTCGAQGYPKNFFDCVFSTSTNFWSVYDASGCDSTHEPDSGLCSGTNIRKFGDKGTNLCIPCKLQGATKISHGGDCTNTPNDCGFELECLVSITGGKKCLYPGDRDKGGDCIVGENECVKVSPITLEDLMCGNWGDSIGTFSNCQKIKPKSCNFAADCAKPVSEGGIGIPGSKCDNGVCVPPEPTPPPNPTTPPGQLPFNPLESKKICEYAGEKDGNDADEFTDGPCGNCLKAQGVWTPFGCIGVNPQKFVESLLQLSIGIAGGIAFLMMVYAGFIMMTSSGNPEKLTHGREIFASAIAGLILIIFSAIILKIIGVDILKIPGFQ